MCRRHWRMVPIELQRAVWAAYRRGQCDDKRPSEAWHDAADAAIKFVAELESRQPKNRQMSLLVAAVVCLQMTNTMACTITLPRTTMYGQTSQPDASTPAMTDASQIDGGVLLDSGVIDAGEVTDSGPGPGCQWLTTITCESCIQSGATCDNGTGTCCFAPDASQLDNDSGVNTDGGLLTPDSGPDGADGGVSTDGGSVPSNCVDVHSLLGVGEGVPCSEVATPCAEHGGTCSNDPNMTTLCCCEQAASFCSFPDAG